MNPLLVSGFGTSISVDKRRLVIYNRLSEERLEFYPHQIDHDSIIVDGHTGGAGNDLLEFGNDKIRGTPGTDHMLGDYGFGQDGDDTLVLGNDMIFGGAGADVIKGDAVVLGDGTEADVISGGGNDVLRGGDGEDTIYCEQGNDLARGGRDYDKASTDCERQASIQEKIAPD